MKTIKKIIVNKKIIIGAILAGVGIGIYFLFFYSAKPDEPRYSVVTLSEQDPLLLKGEVKATQTESVFYEQTLGTLSGVSVKNDQEVKVGDKLITYQNSDAQTRADQQQRLVNKSSVSVQQAEQNLGRAQTRYNEAQASLTQSKTELNRAIDSEEKETLASTVEQKKTEMTSLNNEVIQATQALELAYVDVNDETTALESEKGKVSSTVTATIDGIAIVNEAGKKSAETPLIQVLSKAKQVKGIVTEYDLNKLKLSQEVSVSSISTNETMKGKISSINLLPKAKGASEAEIPTYEFIVEGEFSWAYGSSVQVAIRQPQLFLPEKAIISEDEHTFVYVYKEGKATKTEVNLTDMNGIKKVESGVSEGEKIISNPDEELKDQAEVQVIEND